MTTREAMEVLVHGCAEVALSEDGQCVRHRRKPGTDGSQVRAAIAYLRKIWSPGSVVRLAQGDFEGLVQGVRARMMAGALEAPVREYLARLDVGPDPIHRAACTVSRWPALDPGNVTFNAATSRSVAGTKASSSSQTRYTGEGLP